MKNISLLGSTGSIGKSTCDIVDEFPERFRIVGMSAGANIDLFERQIRKFRPSIVSMVSEDATNELRRRLGNPNDIIFCSGELGISKVASFEETDTTLVAVVGASGLLPTASAINAGKEIALANKETMVMAGEIISAMAKDKGVSIIPVDSEHNAIFQCLAGSNIRDVEKLILTASGGPFLDYSLSELEEVTPSQALKHPNWSMGSKITIDSATLMNKGLEVIEAYWLFDCDFDKINVVVHPQSIIHSMVQYVDGSVIAQMGLPDMRLPILYALTYPERIKFNSMPRLNFYEIVALSFQKPDMERFPCLGFAFDALKEGNGTSTVINAANEIVVDAFLKGSIGFTKIPKIIYDTVCAYNPRRTESIEDTLEIDKWARHVALNKI